MQTGDILIQAGHEGKQYGSGDCSPYGSELDWTPIVADEAARILANNGFDVIRVSADLTEAYHVKIAVYIHFDSRCACGNCGASVAYEGKENSAAEEWKNLYSKFWPYAWTDDNFCKELHHYYGFTKTEAADSKMVLELGDLTNEEQARWLQPRLQWLGRLVAYFLAQRLGKTDMVLPRPALNSTSDMLV